MLVFITHKLVLQTFVMLIGGEGGGIIVCWPSGLLCSELAVIHHADYEAEEKLVLFHRVPRSYKHFYRNCMRRARACDLYFCLY